MLLTHLHNLFYTPIQRCPWLFSSSLLLAYGILVLCLVTSTPLGWFLAVLLPLSDCYLLCLLAYGGRKIKIQVGILTVVLLLGAIEIFVVLFYHSTISPQVIQLVLETNGKESQEFIQSAWASSATWLSVCYFLLIIGLSMGVVKLVQKYPIPKWVSYIGMLLILWSGIRQVSDYAKLARCFQATSLSECMKEDNLPHLNAPCERLLYGLAFNKVASQELIKLSETVAQTQVDSCTFECPLIVLIIGESYNKHHSPLYEPAYLNTTPRLLERAQAGELAVFTDAVSPHNLTSIVFKYLFSTWDETCKDDWTQHTLFPAVFKKAGYQVHFRTNQFVEESKDFHDFAGGTLFNTAALSTLQFTTRNRQAYPFDGELLAEIPSMDRLTQQPSLLIMHLIGQHMEYKERYPAEYAKFKPEDESTLFGGETGKQIAAAYDNAVYYNDAVVDSIFKVFQKQDAICIYLADHGEEAYDWRDAYSRTSEAEITPEIARNQYEIPLLVYMPPLFQENHPDMTAMVWEAQHRRFISSDLSNILFYLAGIQTQEYREKHNVLSPAYQEQRKRMIRSDTDYDSL